MDFRIAILIVIFFAPLLLVGLSVVWLIRGSSSLRFPCVLAALGVLAVDVGFFIAFGNDHDPVPRSQTAMALLSGCALLVLSALSALILLTRRYTVAKHP